MMCVVAYVLVRSRNAILVIKKKTKKKKHVQELTGKDQNRQEWKMRYIYHMNDTITIGVFLTSTADITKQREAVRWDNQS